MKWSRKEECNMKKKIIAVLVLAMTLAMESVTVFATGSQSPTSTTVITGDLGGATLSGNAGDGNSDYTSSPISGDSVSGDSINGNFVNGDDPANGVNGNYLSGAISPKTSNETANVSIVIAMMALAGVATCSKKLVDTKVAKRRDN
jgi:hypothetical protein